MSLATLILSAVDSALLVILLIIVLKRRTHLLNGLSMAEQRQEIMRGPLIPASEQTHHGKDYRDGIAENMDT